MGAQNSDLHEVGWAEEPSVPREHIWQDWPLVAAPGPAVGGNQEAGGTPTGSPLPPLNLAMVGCRGLSRQPLPFGFSRGWIWISRCHPSLSPGCQGPQQPSDAP